MKPKQYMLYLGGFLILLAFTDIVGAILNLGLNFQHINELVIKLNISKELIIAITIVMASVIIILALLKLYCGYKGILEAKGKNKSENYIKLAKVIFTINVFLVIVKWLQVFTGNGNIGVVSVSTVSVFVLYQFVCFSKVFIHSMARADNAEEK